MTIVVSLLLCLLPVLAFASLFFTLRLRFPDDDLRRTWVEAMLLWGAWLVLTLEGLSLFNAVNRPGLALAWLLPSIASAAWIYRQYQAKRSLSLAWPAFSKDRAAWLAVLPVIFILLVTALVAWISPPQTWDSLTYHMPRLARWAQEGAVRHYATGIERQNGMSPAAEMSMLLFYVLSASDRLAPFTQWFAMLGSLLGVSIAASLLGAAPLGQVLAAGFAATLPMGIVQASSTITDYTATVWCLYAAVECLYYLHHSEKRSLVFAALAAGLAFLAKATAAAYLLPFALLAAVLLGKRQGIKAILHWGLVGSLVFAAINAGFIGRNLLTFQTITSPGEFKHNNQLKSLRGLTSNVLRNATFQAGLPGQDAWNEGLYLLVAKIHVKMGLTLDDPRTTLDGYYGVRPPDTGEDITTNPYHAYLIVLFFLLALLLARQLGWSTTLYAILVSSGMLLFSLIFKWNVFGSRYLLPFFVLFSPVIGVILSRMRPRLLGILVILGLVYGATPWLFSIKSRPLVDVPQSTLVEPILKSPRLELYFANAGKGMMIQYQQISQAIQGNGCQDIGLMLGGDDPEYLLWVLLGAPRPDLQIEWLVSGTPSARYSDPTFQPCAVVCNSCDQAQAKGLPLSNENGDLRLYMQVVK